MHITSSNKLCGCRHPPIIVVFVIAPRETEGRRFHLEQRFIDGAFRRCSDSYGFVVAACFGFAVVLLVRFIPSDCDCR
jgi:hypothetical protein